LEVSGERQRKTLQLLITRIGLAVAARFEEHRQSSADARLLSMGGLCYYRK
jgi:hypothetical protein